MNAVDDGFLLAKHAPYIPGILPSPYYNNMLVFAIDILCGRRKSAGLFDVLLVDR